jgi:hypothetical protein
MRRTPAFRSHEPQSTSPAVTPVTLKTLISRSSLPLPPRSTCRKVLAPSVVKNVSLAPVRIAVRSILSAASCASGLNRQRLRYGAVDAARGVAFEEAVERC